MNWTSAIERNTEALKRVLAALIAMAGLTAWPVSQRAVAGAPVLPRHLHRAILRLLRPAESAARRLVIVVARGLVVALPRQRRRTPKPAPTILRNGVGTGIVMPRGFFTPANAKLKPARKLTLPQFDRIRRPARFRASTTGVPRISFPGLTTPFPVAPRRPLTPHDPIDASRLALRLSALTAALNDLPAHARRFACWQVRAAAAALNRRSELATGARADARDTRGARRLWPLRPGRPPGACRRPDHAVHAILTNTHALAFEALERPDTS